MEDITGNIATNLQAIRKEKQLTLQELADVTGVSKSMLGEIERGSSSPTITVLWKISTGLRITISDLIYEKRPDFHLAHPEDWNVLQEGDGYIIALIFEYKTNRNFEVYHLFFDAHSRYDSDRHQPGVKEYTMVYEGQLTLTVAGESFALNAGDSFIFDAGSVHSYHNDQDVPAKAYSVIYYPF